VRARVRRGRRAPLERRAVVFGPRAGVLRRRARSGPWRGRPMAPLAAAAVLALLLVPGPGSSRDASGVPRGGVTLVGRAAADDFSFSHEEEKSKREHEQAAGAAAPVELSAACRKAIARRRTVIVVAESIDGGGFRTRQSAYGPHLQTLAHVLRALGVRTYTPEEIRAQVAQAEIDAYFRNDPDAALAASSKLGADLVLRGVISSRSVFNEFMGLPEVAVSIGLALADRSGCVLSEATASADSYSGYDTLGMALRLVNEQAPGVVSRLFADYCRRAAH
jgi:hypothetical protein